MPRLRELATGVLLATSDLYLTNTTVVVSDDHRALLVDPALLPQELTLLAEELEWRGLTVEVGFATHAHWDHVLWPSELAAVPRFAAAETVATLEAYREPMVLEQIREAEAKWYCRWDLDQVGRLQALDGRNLTWSGVEAEVIVHDGHVPGHAALHFPALRLLVAGDMVSDVEPPGLDWSFPDQVARYRAGLDRLAAAADVDVFVPGHGRPGDGRELRRRLAADREGLDAVQPPPGL